MSVFVDIIKDSETSLIYRHKKITGNDKLDDEESIFTWVVPNILSAICTITPTYHTICVQPTAISVGQFVKQCFPQSYKPDHNSVHVQHITTAVIRAQGVHLHRCLEYYYNGCTPALQQLPSAIQEHVRALDEIWTRQGLMPLRTEYPVEGFGVRGRVDMILTPSKMTEHSLDNRLHIVLVDWKYSASTTPQTLHRYTYQLNTYACLLTSANNTILWKKKQYTGIHIDSLWLILLHETLHTVQCIPIDNIQSVVQSKLCQNK